VVLAPSALTPLTGERIQWVFERAGLPDGIVRTVHDRAALVATDIAKVLYTGPAAEGRRVAVACAERAKGAVLELGGSDPMVVLADADLEHAVAGCAWAGFANAGQSPSAVRRVYASRELAGRFTQALVAAAGRLRLGDPVGWDVDMGPLASPERFAALRELVDDAVAAGATLECGGPVGDGPFFAPAVLTEVTQDMRIMREEVLGPVVCVTPVRDEEEAIELANDSAFGLGASVWTTDHDRGRRIARRLEAGSVWINDHMYSHAAMQAPWGGVKGSGTGRRNSRFGLYECVNVKHVGLEPGRLREFWWQPYDESVGRALHAAAQLLYGRDDDKRDALRDGAGPLIRIGRRMLGR
jgi:succinate-semialdehyde dehydrogenase/glutarate-semialdehyde dehydrogenase